ncbi:transketolase [Corynebacterium renale]|uniref:Transketolase n=1 Tax=Corynebacterium renale TaxID=1724 RepID=A0A2A9DPJ8_9CORY|nr:transketolase [Corynebacterium renale]PFG28677.1 transketolase [Corynebacterium renale]SQI26077.1 transketolase [Corynebacterium renale]
MTLTPEQKARTERRYPENWSDLDTKAIDTARVLAADSVQNCGSGHPGTAMSLAPLAYTLYQRVMNHDPQDTAWAGRDRFVLSCGHSSLTQYIQLYLGGFGLELDDLKALRTWGSLTPGHPEYGHTDGVEITTGPLGQGLATAVGMAMAARRERGLFDPEAPAGESPFDHFVYVIASDGDLQEGVTSEASSLAGTQKLGNLIVFWDDNEISIEDDTDIAFNEDVVKRYEAYGWHTQEVASAEDVVALEEAIAAAKAETTRPSFIRVRSIIGYPAPNLQNTGAAHGAALGDEEVAAVKEILGFNPEQTFAVAEDVIAHTRKLQDRGAEAHAQWQKKFDEWAEKNPENAELFRRLAARELPAGWDEELPTWNAGDSVATRKASSAALQALGKTLPELWGGSADLAGSNNTVIEGADSFGPESITTDTWTAQPYGRNLHFGIREHAMGAILNGMALHGGTRPYGGTFLIFSEYMRPALRLGALMGVSTYHVWTHDSIGLGEDGPTHQPIEQLAALRAMPGLTLVRPADANETAAAWRAVLADENGGPKGLALSRQNLPVLDGTKEKALEGVARGAYVLVKESGDTPDVILMGSGSEVELAVSAAAKLEEEGVSARVVSVPSLDWFEQQDAEYIEEVLPTAVKARVSVEAGIAMPWYRWLGDGGKAVSLEHFGASADYKTLYKEFGITADAVYEAAREVLDK